MGADDRKLLRIGDVAEAAGTTTRTIRYYEEIGLLPASGGRQPGSHRLYDVDDVDRLKELLNLKELLGVSLEELRELVAAGGAKGAASTAEPAPARAAHPAGACGASSWTRFGYDAARFDAAPHGLSAAAGGGLVGRRVDLPGTVDSSPIYLGSARVGGR